jgi:hypothetical protein
MADVISAQAEWVEVIDINVKAGTQMNLLGGARGSIPATIRPPQIRFLSGKPFAFVEAFHFVAGQGVDSLFRVNLSNGDTTLIAEGRPDTSAWLVGGDGLPLVESRYNAKLSQWALLVRRGDIWRLADVRQTDFGYQGVLGLGRDGRSVLASADRGDALRELPPGGDTWSVPFSVPDDRNLIEDPADGRLLGDYALIGDTDRYTFFAPADQAIWDAAVGHFPGAGVELAGLSDDHQTVLVGLDSTTDGPGYAIFDNRTGGVRMLGGVYAGLTADDIAPVQSIAFTAADGLPLT